MIVIPAVNLRNGACVQPSGASSGAPVAEPITVVRDWAHLGFAQLHVSDLDAEAGAGSNAGVVDDIVRDGSIDVEVGGGVRRTEDIQRLFEAGASRVVLGDRGVEEPEWTSEVASMYPSFLVVAAAVRDRRVASRGLVRSLPRDVLDFVDDLQGLPLAGILVRATQPGRDGAQDLAVIEDIADRSGIPIFAAGGIAGLADLRALEHRGVAAAIVGRAFVDGSLDAHLVAHEFGR